MPKISKTPQSKQKNTLDNYVKKQLNNAYLELLDEEELQVNDPNKTMCVLNTTAELVPNKTENGATIPVSDPKTSGCAPIDLAKIVMLEEKCAKLELQNKKLLKDNKALKKLLSESKNLILYKDIQLKKLNENEQSKETKQLLFEKHNEKFTEEQLIGLRSVPKGKSKDSEFMTLLMGFLYGDHVEKMCVKQKRGCNKTEISQDIMTMFGEMLWERVNSECIPQQTVLMRCSSLKRLISCGIYNNNRKKRSSQAKAGSTQVTAVATGATKTTTGFTQTPVATSSMALPNYNTFSNAPTFDPNSYYGPHPYPHYPYPPYQYPPYSYHQGYFQPQ